MLFSIQIFFLFFFSKFLFSLLFLFLLLFFSKISMLRIRVNVLFIFDSHLFLHFLNFLPLLFFLFLFNVLLFSLSQQGLIHSFSGFFLPIDSGSSFNLNLLCSWFQLLLFLQFCYSNLFFWKACIGLYLISFFSCFKLLFSELNLFLFRFL